MSPVIFDIIFLNLIQDPLCFVKTLTDYKDLSLVKLCYAHPLIYGEHPVHYPVGFGDPPVQGHFLASESLEISHEIEP